MKKTAAPAGIFKILILLIWAGLACDKGLSPPEATSLLSDFPVEPEGGSPVGVWEPDSLHPVEATLLDMDKIAHLVDSLKMESTLEGFFSFDISEACSIHAVLTIKPYVYLKDLPAPLILEISDTLRADGPYSINDGKVLSIPLDYTTFDLDTLGITQKEDALNLISMVRYFPYEGFSELRYYLIIHLNRRENENSARMPSGTLF
jgi:hypothetical protein